MKISGFVGCVLGDTIFEFGDVEGETEQEFKANLIVAFEKAAQTVRNEWDGWQT